jgi:phage-related protein
MTPGSKTKPLLWLHGEIKTPPFSASWPMPSIGSGCHELRLWDAGRSWRIVCFLDTDAIVILEVFAKKSRATPIEVIATCQDRLAAYRQARNRKQRK